MKYFFMAMADPTVISIAPNVLWSGQDKFPDMSFWAALQKQRTEFESLDKGKRDDHVFLVWLHRFPHLRVHNALPDVRMTYSTHCVERWRFAHGTPLLPMPGPEVPHEYVEHNAPYQTYSERMLYYLHYIVGPSIHILGNGDCTWGKPLTFIQNVPIQDALSLNEVWYDFR